MIDTKNTILKRVLSIIENNFDITITDNNTPFTEYGMVSLDIPFFVKILSKEFSVEINVSDIFKCFNVSLLTNYLDSLLNTKKEDDVSCENGARQIRDQIAIVGMSCRLPGGADNVDKYWEFLLSGEDGICEIPKSRWDLLKYYDEDKNAPGKMYCKKGGFLKSDIDAFDARLFNISPKEAQALDPQQRLLLELTWEAFENANLDIARYNGSDTGVYLGISTNEYNMAHLHSGDLSKIGPYSLTGSCFSTACGRIAYTFGFEGPCVSVDTACSSTLSALHLACTALQAKEADIQVVAGINIIESPCSNVGFSKLQATSTDGHSKAFDASADGYGRGEGGGVILLKCLSQAIQDGNEILGVIRSTGINQDGKSNGLTAPNGEAQEKLIRKTLSNAGLNNLDIDYVEMHGTGTKLGDPIEVNAVAAVYGKNRDNNNRLKIGSVKSNIGHLEAAAGISSIIKVLLSMKHGLIPGNLHFHTPNPLINWKDTNLEVVSQHTQWKKDNGLRAAAVNGFGFGGSNAHVIIEEYRQPQENGVEDSEKDGIDWVLKLSAKSKTSLTELVRQYHVLLTNSTKEEFQNIIYTANRCRTDLDYRFAVCAGSQTMLLKRLEQYLDGYDTEGIFVNTKDPLMLQKDRKVAFMFTGQGSQYLNMGKLLYDTNEIFRQAFNQCEGLFKPHLLKSIVELIYGENASDQIIERTAYAQPLIFAIEYALSKMWEDYGIKPDLVMGHSIGEYAAAVEAGILSLEDAVKLVSVRSRLMDQAPGSGSMATIFANREKVTELLQGYENSVCIAARNALDTCVISGSSTDVRLVASRAAAEGITVKELKVSHGFHSMLMNSILNEYQSIADEIEYHPPHIRFVSALYAREIGSEEILDSKYWTRHIREEVDFYGAVSSIEKKENHILMEVGSNRVLSALAKLIFEQDRILVSSLNLKKADHIQIAEDIALLYAAGVNLNWNQIDFAGNESWMKAKLPNYPYEKSNFPMELFYDRESHAIDSADCHKILGQKIDLSHINDTVLFQSKFTAAEPFFMKEHIIFDVAISPAAAHIGMMLAGVKEIDNAKSCTLSNLEFRSPLSVDGDAARKVQLCIEKSGDLPKFSIHSKDYNSENDKWKLHVKGNVKILHEFQFTWQQADINEYRQLSYKADMETRGVYYAMRQSGFKLGDGFRGIKAISFAHKGCICQIEPLKSVPYLNEYVLYPGTIDSILQTGFAFIEEKMRDDGIFKDKNVTVIPYYLEEFTYNYYPSDRLWCDTRSRYENGIIYVDLTVYNDQGQVVIKIINLMAKITDSNSLLRETRSLDKIYYHTDWIPLLETKPLKIIRSDDKYLIISEEKEDSLTGYIGEKMKTLGIEPIKAGMDSDWPELLKSICQNGKKGNLHIIFCGGEEADSCRNDMEQVDCQPVKALLSLIKSISEEGYSQGSSIKIVTRNVQPFKNRGCVNLSGSLLWGLSRVFSIEYPELYNGIIDCDQSVFDQDSNFLDELLNHNFQDICFREKNSYSARLISHGDYLKNAASPNPELKIRPDCCYLITGGTGTVGLTYAEQFVKSGARHLILLCRNEPGQKAIEAIRRFNDLNVKTDIIFADISDYENLKKVLNQVKLSLPPIGGVVHAAGIINDKTIQNAEWSDFEAVIKAKVNGSINLYQLLCKDPLDFFMMTSSVTSVIGNMGQANYAAANYFMNIFASYLGYNQIPGYTLCWGAFGESGMAANNKSISSNMERIGMKPFSKEQAEKIIEDFMERPYENLVVVDADWNQMNKSFRDAAGKNIFLERLVTLETVSKEEEGEEESSVLLNTLKKLPSEEREEFLISKVRPVCAKIMGFESDQSLSLNEALREQGADSLMTFSMRTAINKLFGIDLNISVFFNYPTITRLVEYLLTDVFVFDQKPVIESEESIDDILLEIAELTK